MAPSKFPSTHALRLVVVVVAWIPPSPRRSGPRLGRRGGGRRGRSLGAAADPRGRCVRRGGRGGCGARRGRARARPSRERRARPTRRRSRREGGRRARRLRRRHPPVPRRGRARRRPRRRGGPARGSRPGARTPRSRTPRRRARGASRRASARGARTSARVYARSRRTVAVDPGGGEVVPMRARRAERSDAIDARARAGAATTIDARERCGDDERRARPRSAPRTRGAAVRARACARDAEEARRTRRAGDALRGPTRRIDHLV